MEQFSLSFNVVAPICLMMAAGYVARICKIIDGHTITVMNKVAFRVFMPVLLFQTVFSGNIIDTFDPNTLFFILGATLVNYCLIFFIFRLLEKDQVRLGTLIHGAFRSNTALFGIPVALALLGEGNVGSVAIAVAGGIPLFNVLAVFTLEYHRGGKPNWKSILKGIVTNPLIIGVVLGMAASFLRLQLPTFLASAVKSMASTATPLCFVLLGASFSFASAKHNRKAIFQVALTKLVLAPLLWVSIAALLGWRGQHLLAVVAVFIPPTAVSTFPMAKAMGGDAELAGELVVFTSVISLLTMFIWILAIQWLQLI